MTEALVALAAFFIILYVIYQITCSVAAKCSESRKPNTSFHFDFQSETVILYAITIYSDAENGYKITVSKSELGYRKWPKYQQ